MKNLILILIILPSFLSCKVNDQLDEPELSIIGEWEYQYQLLSDGTKDFDNPYALLEFEYSDGFILNEDHTGSSVWYDKINGSFSWTRNDMKLIITVSREDSSVDYFEYQISKLEESAMEFQSPNGSTYLMIKK